MHCRLRLIWTTRRRSSGVYSPSSAQSEFKQTFRVVDSAYEKVLKTRIGSELKITSYATFYNTEFTAINIVELLQ